MKDGDGGYSLVLTLAPRAGGSSAWLSQGAMNLALLHQDRGFQAVPLTLGCLHRSLHSLAFSPFPAGSPGAGQVSLGGREGAVTATMSGNPNDAPSMCTGENIWITFMQGLATGEARQSLPRGCCQGSRTPWNIAISLLG